MREKLKNFYVRLVLSLFLLLPFSSTTFATEVTVGFGYAKPPFVFALSEADNEENRGIELEIMEEALAYRGHSMKANYLCNDKLIPNLLDEIIDAAATVSQSNEENIYYSDEFVYFWNYAVTQPDDIKRISSIQNLEGRKVFAWQDAIKDLGSDFQEVTTKMEFYKELASQEQQVLLFLQKNADTLVIDWNIFSYFAKKYGYDPIRYHQYNIFGGKTGYKVGFRDAKLRDDFNLGLAYLKSSGHYNKIYNKLWTIPSKIALSNDEQAYLEHKGFLRLCYAPDWMPYEGKTQAGKLDGMSSDYLDLFTSIVGFEVTLHPTSSWSDSLLAIKKRQCDFMLQAKATSERKVYLDFTSSYLSFPYVVVTQSKQGFIDDFEKILDKSYAVVKDDSSVSDLKKRYPFLDLVEVTNISQGLQKVKSGEAFGFIDSTATASRVIHQEGLDLKISAKLPMGYELGVGTRHDEPLLHNILQKAVDAITPEDKQRIENKWLAINIEHVTDYALVYKILIGGFALLSFILYWYKKLQRLNIKLLENEKKLAKYIDIMDENILSSSTDLDGRITEVSKAFCKLTGYSREELIGRNHNILRHLDMQESQYKLMWDSIINNKIWSGEVKNRRKDGSAYWVSATIFPLLNDEGAKIGYMAIRQDVTDKKRIEELSITDELTKLYNRRYFNEVFTQELNRAKRENKSLSFLMLDVDNFKLYNDKYGHQEGDAVLSKIGVLLSSFSKRAEDFAFRIGGEEFGMIFHEDGSQQALRFATKLVKAIEDLKIPHAKNSESEFITASIGLVYKNIDKDATEAAIYKEADDNLYRAKQTGRNRVVQ